MNDNELVAHCTQVVEGNFADSITVWLKFLQLVNKLPGITVLSSIKQDFPGGGFSGLVLISESHAAIHTWPEYNKAWVELATCGDPAALPLFVNLCQQVFR